MNNFKKALVLTLASVSIMTSLTACSDEDVAFGTGVVIGVIIGDDHHHDHHRPPRYRRPHRHSWSNANTQVQDVAGTLNAEFAMNEGAALKLSEALNKGLQGDSSALATVGVNKDDLRSIRMFSVPGKATIARVAQLLNEEPAVIKNVFQTIVTEMESQAQDINSSLWKACLSAGSWRTPENRKCKSIDWTGCSPETGASICAAR